MARDQVTLRTARLLRPVAAGYLRPSTELSGVLETGCHLDRAPAIFALVHEDHPRAR